MAVHQRDLFVFAFLPEPDAPRFVPAGRLTLTENLGAHPNDRQLASAFAYGLKYLQRPNAFELDPVSLGLADRDAVRGKLLFAANGLSEFGGIRDGAPDAWGRRVIEARRKVPANALSEADYLLEAGGDRVGVLDVRPNPESPRRLVGQRPALAGLHPAVLAALCEVQATGAGLQPQMAKRCCQCAGVPFALVVT